MGGSPENLNFPAYHWHSFLDHYNRETLDERDHLLAENPCEQKVVWEFVVSQEMIDREEKGRVIRSTRGDVNTDNDDPIPECNFTLEQWHDANVQELVQKWNSETAELDFACMKLGLFKDSINR